MENKNSDTGTSTEPKKKSTSIVVGGLAGLSVLYLLCPSVLPDVIPIIGSLDEVAATTMLISCFAYFGFDVSKVLHLVLSLIRTMRGGEAETKEKTPADTIEVETTN